MITLYPRVLVRNVPEDSHRDHRTHRRFKPRKSIVRAFDPLRSYFSPKIPDRSAVKFDLDPMASPHTPDSSNCAAYTQTKPEPAQKVPWYARAKANFIASLVLRRRGDLLYCLHWRMRGARANLIPTARCLSAKGDRRDRSSSPTESMT